eukprot:scaffold790_cov387-Prasinococcus_capsulatus_cf.AAC.18
MWSASASDPAELWKHAHLESHGTAISQEVLDWLGDYKGLVRQKPVVCEGDSKHSGYYVETKAERKVGP